MYFFSTLILINKVHSVLAMYHDNTRTEEFRIIFIACVALEFSILYGVSVQIICSFIHGATEVLDS